MFLFVEHLRPEGNLMMLFQMDFNFLLSNEFSPQIYYCNVHKFFIYYAYGSAQ